MSLFITATALAFASPAHAMPLNPTTRQVEAAEPDDEEVEEEESLELSEEEIAKMTLFFETIMDAFFPAGPEPSPARLAAAQTSVDIMLPEGSYGAAMTDMIDQVADRVLDMSEADMVALFAKFEDEAEAGEDEDEEVKPKKAPSTKSFREEWAAKDPQWEAKLAGIKAFASTVFTKMGEAFEPGIRGGMARSMARRYDAKELAEINRFLATPTGQKFGGEVIGIWFDRDVMRGVMKSFPQLIRMGQEMDIDIKKLESLFPKPDRDEDEEEGSEGLDEEIEGEAA